MASELAAIPGGRLRADAAASWLAMRRFVGDETGVWICPTSLAHRAEGELRLELRAARAEHGRAATGAHNAIRAA